VFSLSFLFFVPSVLRQGQEERREEAVVPSKKAAPAAVAVKGKANGAAKAKGKPAPAKKEVRERNSNEQY